MVEKNTMWNAKPHITRSEMRSSLNTSNFIWTTCSCLPLLFFGYFGVFFFVFFVYASKRYKYILFYFLVIFDMNLGSLWYFELQQLAPTTYTTVIPSLKVFHSSFYFAFSLRILFDNQFCGCSNFSVSLLCVFVMIWLLLIVINKWIMITRDETNSQMTCCRSNILWYFFSTSSKCTQKTEQYEKCNKQFGEPRFSWWNSHLIKTHINHWTNVYISIHAYKQQQFAVVLKLHNLWALSLHVARCCPINLNGATHMDRKKEREIIKPHFVCDTTHKYSIGYRSNRNELDSIYKSKHI